MLRVSLSVCIRIQVDIRRRAGWRARWSSCLPEYPHGWTEYGAGLLRRCVDAGVQSVHFLRRVGGEGTESIGGGGVVLDSHLPAGRPLVHLVWPASSGGFRPGPALGAFVCSCFVFASFLSCDRVDGRMALGSCIASAAHAAAAAGVCAPEHGKQRLDRSRFRWHSSLSPRSDSCRLPSPA